MDTERLRKIEERIAWLERHVAAQDKAMLEFAEKNDRLQRELIRLRSRTSGAASDASGPAEPEEERPPHY